MKANEFVKKFGWGAAKHKADELKIIESMGDKLSFEDESLKRLVESHDRVARANGLKGAKKEAGMLEFSNQAEMYNSLVIAINDVESCQ